LTVYDIKGEKVSELVNEYQNSGYYEVEFTGRRIEGEGTRAIASGIYLYKLEVIGSDMIPKYTKIRKMMMVK
jgi:hypothetical protein